MAETRVRPQNLTLNVTTAELLPSFVGMLHIDSNNILRVDSVGAGDILDFITVLPQHTVAGEHGPKVTITQSANDNALAITKGGSSSAVAITITGPTAGKGISITSASNVSQALEVQQNGNADAITITNSGAGNDITAGNWNITQPGVANVVECRTSGSVSVGTTLEVTENATIGGNTTISGTAVITGAATHSSTTVLDGNVTVNADQTSNGKLTVTQTAAANALVINQNANNLSLDINKTAIGAGNLLDLDNKGTGHTISINHDGTAGSAIIVINHDSADSCLDINVGEASEGVRIQGAVANNKSLVVNATNIGGPHVQINAGDTGGSTVLHIANSGIGDSLLISNASGTVATVDKDGNASVQDLTVNDLQVLTKSTVSVTTGTPITAASSFVELHSSSGAQNLDTINTASEGTILILKHGAGTVVLRDGVGNLSLTGNFTMGNNDDTAVLISKGAGGWLELTTANNA